MFPTIQIGSLHLPVFQVCIFAGLVAYLITAIVIIEKKEKTDRKTVNHILVASVFGIAILYVFAFLLNSLFHTIENKKLTIGGITWLGGVLFALPGMYILLHRMCVRGKGYALRYLNLVMPALAIAHAFGRIGCFCGGCCYGEITDSFLGVSFPPHSPAAHTQVQAGFIAHGEWSLPVLPTQLIEASFELLLFGFMLVFYKKLKNHFVETYCFGYGVFRFTLEFLRGDSRGGTGIAMSPSQLMSILLIIGGVLLILYHKGILFKKWKAKMLQYQKETAVYGVHVSHEIKVALKKLDDLRQSGVLTEEEYEQAKEHLQKRQPVVETENS